VRHKPEQTLLYQLVEQYWPEFQKQLSETGRFLPRHVTREFEDYLACGRLENGFEARALRELQPRASGLGGPVSSVISVAAFAGPPSVQLWRQTHGGDRCVSGGSCVAAQTCPPVGTEFPVSVAFCAG
jgi:hypothetical protein